MDEFYDIHWGRNNPASLQEEPLRTGGNWDRIDADQRAAVAKASLVAYGTGQEKPGEKLIAYDPRDPRIQEIQYQKAKQEQGQNWLQGLANTFDSHSMMTSPESISPESIIRNPNWNMLYAVDPQRANLVYKNIAGISFDEALKKHKEQKDFVRKTVQERIAGNRLRQGVTGDWEELMDVPADPNDPTSRGGSKWIPASYQTQDLIKRAGGPEGVGLGNYSNLPLPEMDKALIGAGMSDPAARKSWLMQNALKSRQPAAGSITSAPVLNQIKDNPNQTIGLKQWFLNQANAPFPSWLQNFMDQQSVGPNERAAMRRIGGNIMDNIGTMWSGGQYKTLNPEVTNEDLQKLLPMLSR